MRYLGVDPGETHGLCRLDLSTTGYSIAHLQVQGLGHLYNTIHSIQPDFIVCETFDRRQKPGNIVPIIKGIGIVELYQDQLGVPIELQSASYGKVFWDNGKLKRVGMYSTGLKHANDATRHVLQYVSNKGKDQRFIMMLRPEDFAA